jgi:glycosyltransferase involved in cell wall biosynthesis
VFDFDSEEPNELGYISDPIKFAQELASLDVLLYVTFVECSPMLPLEAMALGVVVLVGPSVEYIRATELEPLIMVANPDSPFEILDKLNFVLENLDVIREKQFEFLNNYTNLAVQNNLSIIEG